MPTITIPDTETLSLGRNGAIGELRVDWSAIPQHVIDHIWAVYSRQFFTDAANSGGADSPMAERLAFAEKKLVACYAGDIRARGESAMPADPVEAEYHKALRATLETAFKQAGLYKGLPKGTKDRVLTVLNDQLRAAGKPEIADFGDYADAFKETPRGQDMWSAAEDAIARRAAGIDVAALVAIA